MGFIAIAGVAAVLLALFLSRKRPDALTAAVVLLALNLLSLAVNRVGLPEDIARSINIACDTLAAIGFVLAWRLIWPPRAWLFVLALTFFAQVTAHRAHDAYVSDPWAVWRLRLALNVIGFAQPLVVIVGPRAGKLAGIAWDAFAGMFRAPRGRDRPRGVASALDRWAEGVGERSVREKSR